MTVAIALLVITGLFVGLAVIFERMIERDLRITPPSELHCPCGAMTRQECADRLCCFRSLAPTNEKGA